MEKSSIFEQMFAFVTEIGALEKKGRNPHFNSEYITFDDIVATIKPLAAKHGLWFMHKVDCEVADGGLVIVSVTPIITNKAGEQFTGGTMAAVAVNNVQQVGSVTTYLKRYSISAMLGIAADVDDDGEANRAFMEEGKLGQVAREKMEKFKAGKKFERLSEVEPDQMDKIRQLIKDLGFGKDEFKAFLASELPNYPQSVNEMSTTQADVLIGRLQDKKKSQAIEDAPDPFA